MKKIFLFASLLSLLTIILVPLLVKADGLVPCGNDPSHPCGISDFFILLANIYKFIVVNIASPLAIIAIIIGGILMLISAGNAELLGKGKKILYAAVIGLVLVFGSWLIINFLLCDVLGYVNPTTNTCNWSIL